MKNDNLQDLVFVAFASCTVLASGAAFAALLYELFTLAASFVEMAMSQQALAQFTR